MIYFLQAATNITDKDINGAVQSYVNAATDFILCEDLQHAEKSLENIEDYVPELDRSNILYEELLEGLNELLTFLDERSPKGQFTHRAELIRVKLKMLQKKSGPEG